MNVTITTKRCECRPTYLEEDTAQDRIERDAWWESVGKHSDYFRVMLRDTDADMHMAIESPKFRRDDPAAASAALGSALGRAAEVLHHRFAPTLAPQ